MSFVRLLILCASIAVPLLCTLKQTKQQLKLKMKDQTEYRVCVCFVDIFSCAIEMFKASYLFVLCSVCMCIYFVVVFFSFAVFLFSPHSRVPIFSNRYTVRSVHSVYVFALRYYKISFSMDYTKTRARRKRHTFFVGRVNKVFFST